MKYLLTLLLVHSIAFAAQLPEPLVPDPQYTNGKQCTVQDKDFSTYRYQEKIPYCKRNVSSKLKQEIYIKYRIPATCRSEYTIDHFYPLSLGGNNDFQNLWPEHREVKRIRQNLEQVLFEQLSRAEITQTYALAKIREEKLRPDISKIRQGSYCEQVFAQRY